MMNGCISISDGCRFRRCIPTAGVLLCAFILAAGMFEAVYGLLQLSGLLPSGNSRYVLTGSFYNPGPYGCFIGSITPLGVMLYLRPGRRYVRPVAAIYLLLMAVLLPASMSRTGWVAALVGSAVVCAGCNRTVVRSIGKARLAIYSTLALVALAGCAIGAYALKPDSADGRMLIWKVALRAIADSPVKGVGWENVAGAYGDAQESYFMSETSTLRERMLAGTPETAFNEYLQVAIAFGVPAALLFALVMTGAPLLYWRQRSYGLAGVATGLAVACVASYPLQFAEFRVTMGLMAIMAFSGAGRWSPAAMCAVAGLWACMEANIKTMDVTDDFNWAKTERLRGNFKESALLLHRILPRTSDPMPLNLIGRNHESLGMRDSAEHYYKRAANRVPNRIYPHYLLMQLYAGAPADSLRLLREAAVILSLSPKAHSKAVSQMRQEARKYLKPPLSYDSERLEKYRE